MKLFSLEKEQIHVITAVTFGNILEWFEVYSFAYLAPIISKQFFNFESGISNLLFSFLVFGLGFITRPLGGIIFGRIGDLFGRKKAFILSIVILTVPTFLMGILPTYETWGLFAPIVLCALRVLQSVPTGGEIPGTICFLFENADEKNRRFVTSWNDVGNQIGAIVGLAETFIMQNMMSPELLFSWGWRISFLSGGLIGLLGIYLRYTLHETPVFLDLKKHHKIDRETTREVISNYKKKIITGAAFGVVDAAVFYLIATYVPTFIGDSLGLTDNQNILVSLIILLITTILLPFFGFLGDKYSNKWMCIISAVLMIFLLYPLKISIENKDLVTLSIVSFFYLIPITCITSLIAYITGNLFPPQVRFTGLGISINLSDGIIGGFTPAISLLLLKLTGSQTGFCWYILFCALISLFAYIKALKE